MERLLMAMVAHVVDAAVVARLPFKSGCSGCDLLLCHNRHELLLLLELRAHQEHDVVAIAEDEWTVRELIQPDTHLVQRAGDVRTSGSTIVPTAPHRGASC